MRPHRHDCVTFSWPANPYASHEMNGTGSPAVAEEQHMTWAIVEYICIAMEEATTITEQRTMLPPPRRTFRDRDELINYVRDFGVTQGYVVTIKTSKRGKRVILGCDRGGRGRIKVEECKQRKRAPSRMINCPFQVVGKLDDDVWILTVSSGNIIMSP
ncbi:hypothetical protein AKJ16_DCAP11706 [Drosera capensis]